MRSPAFGQGDARCSAPGEHAHSVTMNSGCQTSPTRNIPRGSEPDSGGAPARSAVFALVACVTDRPSPATECSYPFCNEVLTGL